MWLNVESHKRIKNYLSIVGFITLFFWAALTSTFIRIYFCLFVYESTKKKLISALFQNTQNFQTIPDLSLHFNSNGMLCNDFLTTLNAPISFLCDLNEVFCEMELTDNLHAFCNLCQFLFRQDSRSSKHFTNLLFHKTALNKWIWMFAQNYDIIYGSV